MRWFVEVASSGQQGTEQWVVEAEQWQPALQAARSLRGDSSQMNGFSIELLEDGYRAIDPSTMLRYVIRRAPDRTPVTRSGSAPTHITDAPRPTSAPAATSFPTSAPPVHAAGGSQAERIAALLEVRGSAPPRPARSSAAPGLAPRPVSASGPAAPPPSMPSPLAALTARSIAHPSRVPDDARGAEPVPRSSVAAPASALSSAPAPAQGHAAPLPPLPPAELLFERAENPTSSSPLTYRESAWFVPEGTSIDAAVRLLAGTFEGVRAALAGVRPGKLVNMAVFDHRFDGKPLRPPLASLTWKDWRDQGQAPDIRRLGEPPHSMRPSFPPRIATSQPPAPPPTLAMPSIPGPPAVPTALGNALAASTRPGANVVGEPLPRPEPAPLPAIPAPAPPPPPPFAAPLAPVSPPAGPATDVPAGPPGAGSAPDDAPPRSVAATAAPVSDAPPTHVSDAAAPAVLPPGEDATLAADGPAAAPVDVPAGLPAESRVENIAPLPPAPTPPPGSGQRQPSSGPPRSITPRPSRPSIPGKRLSGDELIADLFEVMHDLHFLRYPLEGADFVLALIMDKIPSTVGLVHFYDIDSREFVVVRAVGPGSSKVLQIRTSEKEPLIAEAMHKRRAIVLRDAEVARAKNGRWALLDVDTRSVICAPVAQGGRFLGLLEIANPRDGGAFAEGDGHALTYIGEQFSEFLGSRGSTFESDRSPGLPRR